MNFVDKLMAALDAVDPLGITLAAIKVASLEAFEAAVVAAGVEMKDGPPRPGQVTAFCGVPVREDAALLPGWGALIFSDGLSRPFRIGEAAS